MVALPAQAARAVLFLLSVSIVGLILKSLQELMFTGAPAWIAITAILAYLLYRRAERWTGGPAFRMRVRTDLAEGNARICIFEPASVVEHEEVEDEGPSYVIETTDGKRLLLSGQDMVPHKRRGFPWSKFAAIEAPASGVLFRLEKRGESIPVTKKRPQLCYELARDLGAFQRTLVVLGDDQVARLDDEQDD